MLKKLPYERPVITKLQQGWMNKYGISSTHSVKVRDNIDGISIQELALKFGSPLFVFSEKNIRQKVREAQECFKSHYPRVTFGWSYKTNYLDAIAAIYHQENCIAEVVSKMEYEKARNLGVSGKDIIFNGPNKPMDILQRAAADGAKIHIDSFDEIDDLEHIAKLLNKNIDVAIRLNLDAGIYPLWSRFGFNLESGQALDAARRIHVAKRLKLVGLHCHIGTFILDPYAYKCQVTKMVQFSHQLHEQLNIKIEYFDLGGGFPSKSKLKSSYFPPDITIPPLEAFAEQISEALYSSLKPGETPQIYLESGRALIDEAGFLITTVCNTKRLPNGMKNYVLDAGVNILYTSTWYKFNIELAQAVQGVGEPSLVNGPLCMNIDVLDESVILPPLRRGARLILSPVGAYNVTQAMRFIEYLPAIVLISNDNEAILIKNREELSDLIATEKLPDYLKVK